MIKPEKYDAIQKDARRILSLFFEKAPKDMKPQPPVQMLQEIENRIEEAVKYILIETNNPEKKEEYAKQLKTVKTEIKQEKATEEAKKKIEEQKAAKKKQEAKQQDRHVPTDIRRQMFVSKKQPVKQKVKETVSFT